MKKCEVCGRSLNTRIRTCSNKHLITLLGAMEMMNNESKNALTLVLPSGNTVRKTADMCLIAIHSMTGFQRFMFWLKGVSYLVKKGWTL